MSSPAATPRPPARLEHASQGRIRVRLGKDHRQQEVLEALGRRLKAHHAVASVEINPTSGSVLVQGSDTPALRRAMDTVFSIIERAKQEGAGEIGVDSAVGLIKQLDRKLSDATGRRISVRWLVPAAFVTVGVRQAVVQGLSLGVIPWYVLLYYGVDSFLKLFPEYAPQAQQAQKQDRP